MKTLVKNLSTVALVAALTTTALISSVQAEEAQSSSIKLLTAHFDSRKVVQVEAGDFHFKPGQVAPIHTHSAPAVGYVAKGEIIYQVEGEKQKILREGDAFYEPVGPRILRFDNASATEEAIFIDFNLEQEGEPFIVFEKELTEAIDRRTLPTTKLNGDYVDQVDIYSNELSGGETIKLSVGQPILGIVAEGVVVLKVDGNDDQKIVTGASFSVSASSSSAMIVNASPALSAKVITFNVR